MNIFRIRTAILGWIFFLMLGGIAARLFVIQVIEGTRYAEKSRDQTQERDVLHAKRGTIFDRRGKVLAASLENDVRIDAQLLASLENIPRNRSGQKQSVELRRVYPHGSLAGTVLGYIGKDGYGLAGVEYSFDNHLKGEDGWVMLQRDGRNNTYEKVGLPKKEPVDGSDVYLSIDLEIQKIVHNVLKQAVVDLGAHQAMCIVMDPATGKVLAMADEPSCNPNVPLYSPLAVRTNRTIGYNYEPGSTFKILPASCALQEKIFRELDIIDGNNGVYVVYNQAIRDMSPRGKITFSDALKYSSNVCFAKVADQIGNDRLFNYTRNFGFGARTGIELPGEETGIVHPIEKWSGRTRVTMAIGQEISVTMLQMMDLFSCVANGGVLVKPTIYEKIVDPQGKTVLESEYTPIRRVLSSNVAERVRSMMVQVVENGTGQRAAIKGVSIAGKTGTSQKIDSTTLTYSSSRSWVSFIGFAPADEPALVCGVVIDEPYARYSGGSAAAPCFQKIMSQIISHPDLEFAEEILGTEDYGESDEIDDVPLIPDVCGNRVGTIRQLLKEAKIPFVIQGKGSHIVYQNIKAGNILEEGATLVLHAGVPELEKEDEELAENSVLVPDCLGKDLREAIETVLQNGLKPYSVGAGTVRMQSPSVGALIQKAEVCTLVCSFGG